MRRLGPHLSPSSREDDPKIASSSFPERFKSVKTQFLTPLPRFSSILELSLGPSWAHLAPILGHLGPLDGPKRALTEPSDVPFTGRRLSCSVDGPGAILFRLRAGCYLGAPHGPNCTVILKTVPKRKGGRYNAPWASSIRPPIVRWVEGRARPMI